MGSRIDLATPSLHLGLLALAMAFVRKLAYGRLPAQLRPCSHLNVIRCAATASTARPDMAMIKALREQTGAPIVDVKKALVETECDMTAAVAWLRKKGVASAAKKAGREASEGLIALAMRDDGQVAAIVELACETDFVARTQQFQDLAKAVAATALDTSSVDPQTPTACPVLGDDVSVSAFSTISLAG